MWTVLSDAFIRMCWKGGCGLWRWACQAWCLNLIRVFKIWLTGLGWGELRALPLTNTDINGICQWPARQKDGQDRGTKLTINNSWPPGGGEEEEERRWPDRDGLPAWVVNTSAFIKIDKIGEANKPLTAWVSSWRWRRGRRTTMTRPWRSTSQGLQHQRLHQD